MARILIALGTVALTSGVAIAQPVPLDASDPSVTKRVALDGHKSAMPEYPLEALRKGLQGNVKVGACIDAKGQPHTVSVLTSSGHPILDEAARQWVTGGARFSPAEVNGAPTAVCNYVLTYEWRVPKPQADPTIGYENAFFMAASDKPVLLSRPDMPPYPRAALEKRRSDTIRLSLCVGPDGDVDKITVKSTRADRELVMATFEWVRQSKYRSGKKNGQPVGVCGIDVEHTWKLPN